MSWKLFVSVARCNAKLKHHAKKYIPKIKKPEVNTTSYTPLRKFIKHFKGQGRHIWKSHIHLLKQDMNRIQL